MWYKPDKIEQSKVTPIEVYGVLNGKIKQVSEDVEGIATPLLYKGSVSDISQLPLSPKIGWMYNISEKSIYGEAGMNVAWTGEIWDTLGPAIDMAPYLREDSEIITSLKTKTENLESANYTDRGTLADTDAFLINDGTGMKKSVLSKLSDFVLNKIADKVFEKLQTNDKTILGAINELNSKSLFASKWILIDIAAGRLSSLEQLKFSGICKFNEIDEALLTDSDGNKMNDLTGDYYAVLIAQDFSNNGGVAYGTLLLFSPRIHDGFWYCNIWASEIRRWRKILLS